MIRALGGEMNMGSLFHKTCTTFLNDVCMLNYAQKSQIHLVIMRKVIAGQHRLSELNILCLSYPLLL